MAAGYFQIINMVASLEIPSGLRKKKIHLLQRGKTIDKRKQPLKIAEQF